MGRWVGGWVGEYVLVRVCVCCVCCVVLLSTASSGKANEPRVSFGEPL